VKSEDEPVTADERVVRLVWREFLRPGEPLPISPTAFKPRRDETDGISVFRVACLADAADALTAMQPAKRGGYAIATLPVADLTALGLTVRPARIDAVPGHALLPELNAAALVTGKYWCKTVMHKLAELASQHLTPPADPA
jgi:hypothetical protein